MHRESPAALYLIYVLSMLLYSIDRLLYTDKGGVRLTLLSVEAWPSLCQQYFQPIALSLFYNERPALQYNAK